MLKKTAILATLAMLILACSNHHHVVNKYEFDCVFSHDQFANNVVYLAKEFDFNILKTDNDNSVVVTQKIVEQGNQVVELTAVFKIDLPNRKMTATTKQVVLYTTNKPETQDDKQASNLLNTFVERVKGSVKPNTFPNRP